MIFHTELREFMCTFCVLMLRALTKSFFFRVIKKSTLIDMNYGNKARLWIRLTITYET